MPLQATSGAASYDAFGGGAAAVIPYYIEDMFSCFLYTGNATARSIVNNIDISGNGGLVWTKSRSLTGSDHFFVDTDRGATKFLNSNSSAGQVSTSDITAFNSTGYALNSDVNGGFNNNGATFASWTFRKQPKFFDVVTYTGTNGVQTINHSLGSAPGCIIVKSTSTASQWNVYHRSLGATQALKLQATFAASSSVNFWNDTEPTATQFTLGASFNTLGETYVAYLFAHNAGGFGLTGTDNVISCGSFTTSGTSDPNATVNLGYEPQWVMLKKTNSTGDWIMYDTMRGVVAYPRTSSAQNRALYANLSNAEGGNGAMSITSTGFATDTGGDAQTFIYIAIRKGPMKVPTLGTSVFTPVTRTGTGADANITGVGFAPDLVYSFSRTNGYDASVFIDRLRGNTKSLQSYNTTAELTNTLSTVTAFGMDGISVGYDGNGFINGPTGYVNYFMRRAPSFFDEVCYTQVGTSGIQTLNHNLAVVPELVILKTRSSGDNWRVRVGSYSGGAIFNSTAAFSGILYVDNLTTTTFGFNLSTAGDANGTTFVAYLFATCANVSKVGTYTGTGTTQTINCGFTAGARFVLIKRTDSTGDWYVWDSARGIISGNDPYFLTNSTNAQVTGTDYIDPYSAGFEISSTAPAEINASGGTFIFLAIA